MEKLNKSAGQSMDIVADNIAKLKELFPEILTENKIDFKTLQALLGEEVETEDERYSFNWHGKANVRRLAQSPSSGTLRPFKEEAINWDNTQNLFIEGDNLEVLKLLQKSYHNQVKLIYIDPPYNTGKDFVYPDNFHDNIKNYLQLTGQLDGGRKISSNAEANGRFHTDWLNMIYPRLKLARNLLKDDGLIAISIDDWELPRLIMVIDEVFGEDNFINLIAVKSSEASGVKMSHVEKKLPKLKEYIILVGKRRELVSLHPVTTSKVDSNDGKIDGYLKYYSKIIQNPDAPCDEWVILTVPEFMIAEGIEPTPDAVRSFKLANASRVIYRTNSASLENLNFDTKTAEVISPTGIKYVWWEGKQMLFLEDYLHEAICDLWTDISTINLNKEICGVEGFGEGQKPIELLSRILQLIVPSATDSIIIDFFAGSGTTGHAVMAENLKDSGNRRFILVQLPEPLDIENKDQKTAASFCDRIGKSRTIAELTKERLRRAAKKIKEENPDYQGDLGFKVFKLDSSNLKPWDADFDSLANDLAEATEVVKAERSAEDVLFEILLKYGLDLTLPIATHTLEGKTVYEVGAGALVVCLDSGITEAVAEAIGKLKETLEPEVMRVVFKDSGFANDAAKVNAVQVLKQFGIDDVKSI